MPKNAPLTYGLTRDSDKFRCRKCGCEFTLKPSPKRFKIIKCRKCKSTDVEFI